DGPDEKAYRLVQRRVREAEKLPRAEMRGQEDDAASALARNVEEFDILAVVLGHFAQAFGADVRELADLAELSAEAQERAAQNLLTLVLVPLRECEFEVAHTHAL